MDRERRRAGRSIRKRGFYYRQEAITHRDGNLIRTSLRITKDVGRRPKRMRDRRRRNPYYDPWHAGTNSGWTYEFRSAPSADQIGGH